MNIRKIALFGVLALSFVACSRQGYVQPPFGGMKGRVREVRMYHIMPDEWRLNSITDTVMYINATVYDIYGNEIMSVLMDSAGRMQSQTENMFENGVCISSTQKNGARRTVAEMHLVSHSKGLTVYNQKRAGRTERLEVRERKRFGKYTSVVALDGKTTMESTITANDAGLPVEIVTVDASGKETVQKNTYSADGDIVEKHILKENGTRDDVTTTEYIRFDEKGNWIEAHTFNRIGMTNEFLIREIEYWE